MAKATKLIIPIIILLTLFACKSKPKAENTADLGTDTKQPSYEEPQAESKPSVLQSFKYSWTASDEMPNIVIIIDDFGNSAGQLLEDFADLPSEIVFAILPDLPHSKTAANIGSQKGHEIIIHIPMEAENSNISPGQRFISKNAAEGEIEDLIEDFYNQIPMAIAANNHMGSATTANLDTMNRILKVLKNNGLFFIDSATTAQSAVYTAGIEQGILTARRDIFLDVPDVSDETLAEKINSLGKYKGRKEPIIIISHCHNRDKLVAMQKFITQIEGMGLRIVSLRDAFPNVVL
nr:uncharacterized protein [Candidatus Cloacimonadota bacterium]